MPRRSPLDVVLCGPVLEVIADLPLPESPSIIAVFDQQRYVWSPRGTVGSFTECRHHSGAAEWRVPVTGRARQLGVCGDITYILSGEHAEDQSWVTVVDGSGAVCAVHRIVGFASALCMSDAGPRRSAAIVACDRMLTNATITVFFGTESCGAKPIRLPYQWANFAPLPDGGWAIGSGAELSLTDERGVVIAQLAPPKKTHREKRAGFRTSLDSHLGRIADVVMGRTSTDPHWAVLGLTPPVKPESLKRRYRELLMNWHPDRNPAPEATEMTRRILAAYHEAKSSPDGPTEATANEFRTWAESEHINSIVADCKTGEIAVGCHSGSIFSLRGRDLVPVGEMPKYARLIASTDAGTGFLFWENDLLATVPANAGVARLAGLRTAWTVHARAFGKTGNLFAFTGSTRDLFIGRPGFSGFHHVRFRKTVRDVAYSADGGECLVAAGNIFRVRLASGVASPPLLGPASPEGRLLI